MSPFSSWLGKMFTEELPAEAAALTGAGLISWAFGRRKTTPTGPYIDIRGQLYADITKIENEVGDKLANLRRRLEEARKGPKSEPMAENKMVNLLAKIPSEYEARKQVLLALDAAPDEEFTQALAFLEHDAIWQFLALIWKYAQPAFQQAYNFAKKAAEYICGTKVWSNIAGDTEHDGLASRIWARLDAEIHEHRGRYDASAELYEDDGSYRADVRDWMRRQTATMQDAHEERLAHEGEETYTTRRGDAEIRHHRRLSKGWWVIGGLLLGWLIVTIIVALTASRY